MYPHRGRRFDPAAMLASENSVWDVYNNIADVRDDELIRNWSDNLNFLLIFAAIFAAVLTALIVESMKLLREDPGDVATAILIRISSQLANTTTPPYQAVVFEAPQYAVLVNALLFASLCCSLIAALAGVIALQWVNEYDAHIDTVDVRKHALIRHFRFVGVETWRMGEIIAILPLLLHVSVFLFFAGILVWVSNLNPVISHVCVGGLSIAAAFYIITACITASFGNAPFRTPVAKALRFVLFFLLMHVTHIAVRISHYFWWQMPLEGFLARPWAQIGRTIRSLEWKIPPLFYTWLLEKVAAEDSTLELQTLIWAAARVEIAPQSLHRSLYIFEQACSVFTVDKELPRHWYESLDQVAELLVKDFISRTPSEADVKSITIFIRLWAAFGRSFWARQMFYGVTYLDWEQWHFVIKLIGPLDLDGPLTDSDVMLVTKLVQLHAFQTRDLSVRFLEDISAEIRSADALPSWNIVRYAISSLSMHLWTNASSGEASERAAELLIELMEPSESKKSCFPLPKMELALVCTALHSVVFGRGQGLRRFWASRHPIVSPTGSRLNFIPVVHSTITRHFGQAAAESKSEGEVRTNLRRLCRFLAYSPTTQIHNETTVDRAEDILTQVPHFMEDPGVKYSDRTDFAALPSLIWVHKMRDIPSIHDYLALLLSCKRRFPTIASVWRDWSSVADIRRYMPVGNADIDWLLTQREDRRLTDVLSAFDLLITDGCSRDRHLVMVHLAIEDLSHIDDDAGHGYYTDNRKEQLAGLRDPALRLVGARAATMSFSGRVPPCDDKLWSEDPWITAIEFWLTTYVDCDGPVDDMLLSGVLLQTGSRLRSTLVDASSRKSQLQNRLRRLLESTANKHSDSEQSLLIHASACNAVWFADHLTQTGTVERLITILSSAGSIELGILPLFPSLIRCIESSQSLLIILKCLESMISDQYPPQADIDAISAALEGLLLVDPQWMKDIRYLDAAQWTRTMELINMVVSHLRENENRARAILRYNGRSPALGRYPRKFPPNDAELEPADSAETVQAGGARDGRSYGWQLVRNLAQGGYLRKPLVRPRGKNVCGPPNQSSEPEETPSVEVVALGDGGCPQERFYSCSASFDL